MPLLNPETPTAPHLAGTPPEGVPAQGHIYEESDEEPYVVIAPSSGWSALNLKQIWQYRDLLVTLAGRDVKLRYRQTLLGAIWVIIQPLLAAGIFSFVFGTIGKFPSDGVPYLVFSYAGMLAWNLFSTTLNKTSTVLIQNAPLISKVYFPRLILPLSVVLPSLIDFGVAFTVMVVLLVAFHVVPGVGFLLLPVWLLLLLLLAVGLGLFSSALAVSYRDVQFVMPVVLQMLLYASPIAYPVSGVPAHLRFYFMMNPLSGLLEAFRWSLIGRGELRWEAVAYSAVVSIAVFLLGAFAFKKMERKFADVI